MNDSSSSGLTLMLRSKANGAATAGTPASSSSGSTWTLRSKTNGAAAGAPASSAGGGDSSPETGPYPGGMKCSRSTSLSAGVGVGRSKCASVSGPYPGEKLYSGRSADGVGDGGLMAAPGKYAGNGGGARAAPKSFSSPRNGAAGPPRSQSIGGMWNADCRGAAAGLGGAAGAA